MIIEMLDFQRIRVVAIAKKRKALVHIECNVAQNRKLQAEYRTQKAFFIGFSSVIAVFFLTCINTVQNFSRVVVKISLFCKLVVVEEPLRCAV